MKLLRIAGLSLIASVIGSCEKAADSTDVEVASIEWIEASEALEDYAGGTSDQPVVALFTMDWDLIGKMFKKRIEENQASLFPNATAKFIEYDCTEEDSIGLEQLTEAGIAYLPVVFVSYGGGWKHTGLPNDVLDDPNSEDDYLQELRRVISAAKK